MVIHSFPSLSDVNPVGDPPRSPYQEILEEEHTRVDHVVDVFPICHRIITIIDDVIGKG